MSWIITRSTIGRLHGFVPEVDLDYPDNLHDYHRDLSFSPWKQNYYRRNVTMCLLTEYLFKELKMNKIQRVLKFTQVLIEAIAS